LRPRLGHARAPKAPHRVLKPLKRVGPRGSGQWKSITLEELVQEICEGGDLFGEGHVDGLRAIRDVNTLIDEANPEYGPKSNQLLVTEAANEGRTPLVNRFAKQSFGTINVSNHGSYCGQTYRVGTGAALGDMAGMPHGKPDWKNSRFGLFIGTSPAQSGNPFQRVGRELAEARSRGENTYRYVVVSPMLPTSSSHAAGDNNRWLPVKPGSDLALAMGLIRWIIDNERYDKQFLTQPGPAAMASVGEAAGATPPTCWSTSPSTRALASSCAAPILVCPCPSPWTKKHPPKMCMWCNWPMDRWPPTPWPNRRADRGARIHTHQGCGRHRRTCAYRRLHRLCQTARRSAQRRWRNTPPCAACPSRRSKTWRANSPAMANRPWPTRTAAP
jgi:tetrathionate reductase subunit A